jgi:hypothetical protein
MAVPPAVDIQPLMYEVEAARVIGVPARALRSERTAGRIHGTKNERNAPAIKRKPNIGGPIEPPKRP